MFSISTTKTKGKKKAQTIKHNNACIRKNFILPSSNELPFTFIIKKNNDMKTTNLLILKILCNTDIIIIAVSTSSVINNCRKRSFCSTAKKPKNK